MAFSWCLLKIWQGTIPTLPRPHWFAILDRRCRCTVALFLAETCNQNPGCKHVSLPGTLTCTILERRYSRFWPSLRVQSWKRYHWILPLYVHRHINLPTFTISVKPRHYWAQQPGWKTYSLHSTSGSTITQQRRSLCPWTMKVGLVRRTTQPSTLSSTISWIRHWQRNIGCKQTEQ